MSDVLEFAAERYVPARPEVAPDWVDVRARAGITVRPARRIAVALAATTLALGAAAGVAARLGGFDAWLSGTPGKPAPPTVQQAFAAENGRSWTAFPTSTKLRELVRTSAGGREYVLYGFRSGSYACLRLDAVTLRETHRACLPVATLAHSNSAVVVGASDIPLGVVGLFASAQASFGIVADGVERVDLQATDGTHEAVLGGNAYLVVDNEPNSINRFLSLIARGTAGRDVLSLQTGRGVFSFFGSRRRPPGPTRIQAHIRDPRVGWLERHEKRGVSPAQVKLTSEQRRRMGPAGGLRLIKPDPTSDLVVGLGEDEGGALCNVSVTGGGEACSPRADFFAFGAVNWMLTSDSGQGSVVQGVAADGVQRVRVFLADGQVLTPPLRNNVFATRVSTDQLPLRIVGYDKQRRVVSVFALPNRSDPVPAAARRLVPIGSIRGPNGTTAELRAGPATRIPHRSPATPYHCWHVTFSTGLQRGTCEQARIVDFIQPAGDDLFFVGKTFAATTRIEVRFRDSKVMHARPIRGHLLLALPRERLSSSRHSATVVGFSRDGRVLQRQEVAFRTN
jgi:hypothetical protein